MRARPSIQVGATPQGDVQLGDAALLVVGVPDRATDEDACGGGCGDPHGAGGEEEHAAQRARRY
jgi:hypothetical protein